jgi:1,4-alpha-glucan branching enzyme
VTFHYFAPQADAVLLAGDFTQWESSPVRLQREDSGMWSTTVKLPPGRYEYRLLVDGHWQNDPHCSELRPNEFGSANCVCAVSA